MGCFGVGIPASGTARCPFGIPGLTHPWKEHIMHTALIHILITGDYLGYAATGFEEDSPIVISLLALHALLF